MTAAASLATLAGTMMLESKLLTAIPRVRHGFATRRGGVSSGPFATLNLDRGVGDEDSNVQANRARFVEMLRLPAGTEVVQVEQVHGTTVLDEASVVRSAPRPQADALVCLRPDVAIGVRTADCVPILAVASGPRGPEAIAAIHAGWRGATAGIVAATVRHLEAQGVRRSALVFAIGPAIGRDAFEVGEEVVEAARRSLGGDTPPVHVHPSTMKPHLDLRRLVELHLERLDVAPTRIEHVGGCTHSDADLFFSHRRDRGRTGRHLAAIAWTST